MRLLDLFSGIGGFSVGLEKAGFSTVAFCEIEPFCQKVLRKHWPHVPLYDDIKTLTAERLHADDITVDAICGGFPCQDISVAGKGAGIEGARSGLWGEYARLISEIRPQYAIVENVSVLKSRGLDRVLGDLAALGFDAEWHCIPASAIGAPHQRDRIWIVAYPVSSELRNKSRGRSGKSGTSSGISTNNGQEEHVADTDRSRLEGWLRRELQECADERVAGASGALADATSADAFAVWTEQSWMSGGFTNSGWWSVEPNVGRVAHGVPARVDRLRSLGNAVVPQIPEIIGRVIMETRSDWKHNNSLLSRLLRSHERG